MRDIDHRAASEVSQQHRGAGPSAYQTRHEVDAELQVISIGQKRPGWRRVDAQDLKRSAQGQGLYRAVFCRPVLCVDRKNPSCLRNWHPFLPQTRLSIGDATEPVWTGTASDTSGHHEADLHRQQSI